MSNEEPSKTDEGQSRLTVGLDRGLLYTVMEKHGMGGWLMPEKFYGLADAIYKMGADRERSACAVVCDDVQKSGEYDGHQHYGIVSCRNKILERSNA